MQFTKQFFFRGFTAIQNWETLQITPPSLFFSGSFWNKNRTSRPCDDLDSSWTVVSLEFRIPLPICFCDNVCGTCIYASTCAERGGGPGGDMWQRRARCGSSAPVPLAADLRTPAGRHARDVTKSYSKPGRPLWSSHPALKTPFVSHYLLVEFSRKREPTSGLLQNAVNPGGNLFHLNTRNWT